MATVLVALAMVGIVAVPVATLVAYYAHRKD